MFLADYYTVPKIIKGELTILAHDRSGKLLWKNEEHNLIVNKASELMASLLDPNNYTNKGLQYLAVGTGVGTGTLENPQPESSTINKLRSELFRKKITNSTRTNNALTLTTVIDYEEAIGNITEMGLFGGNASEVKDSGFLFNYKVFSARPKDTEIRLTVIWKITF